MSQFYARTQERERLARAIGRTGQSVSLLYGRRRIGKSALITACFADSPATTIYYECKQTSELGNVRSLADLVSERLGYPPLSFSGIEGLLEFLFRQSEERKIVLALDEYPYLRKTVRGLDSVLQALLDNHKDSSNLSLVLCGSFVEVMRSLLEEDNPLYGRVDLTLALDPMDYYDSANFYPSLACEDKVELYSIFGGIPYYNSLIDPERSVRDNIMELIAEPGARLENEIEMYLKSEISKIENANEVFEALAAGYSSYKDILARSHVSSGPAMVDVLKKLISMNLVEKQTPLNEPNNKRRTRYRIVDGLSHFYYRYIFRYASQRSVMNPDAFFERYIEEDFTTNYVPHAFEDLCRQYLVRQNRAGALDEPFELIGAYSYNDPARKRNGEFDVVTQDRNGFAFYEAKYRATPVSAAMILEEVSQVDATGMPCHTYGFFSRSGFTEDARNLEIEGKRVKLIELEELYA